MESCSEVKHKRAWPAWLAGGSASSQPSQPSRPRVPLSPPEAHFIANLTAENSFKSFTDLKPPRFVQQRLRQLLHRDVEPPQYARDQKGSNFPVPFGSPCGSGAIELVFSTCRLR